MLFACFYNQSSFDALLSKSQLRRLRTEVEVGLVGHSKRFGTGCHGYGFCGGDNFTSLCCAAMWGVCVLSVDRLKEARCN